MANAGAAVHVLDSDDWMMLMMNSMLCWRASPQSTAPAPHATPLLIEVLLRLACQAIGHLGLMGAQLCALLLAPFSPMRRLSALLCVTPSWLAVHHGVGLSQAWGYSEHALKEVQSSEHRPPTRHAPYFHLLEHDSCARWHATTCAPPRPLPFCEPLCQTPHHLDHHHVFAHARYRRRRERTWSCAASRWWPRPTSPPRPWT